MGTRGMQGLNTDVTTGTVQELVSSLGSVLDALVINEDQTGIGEPMVLATVTV